MALNVFQRIVKQIRLKHLKTWMAFGRKRYMAHLCKVYRKYGVVFEDVPPRFIAADAYFDTTCPIFVGANSTITSNVLLLTHDYSISYGTMARFGSQEEFSINKPIKIGKECFVGQRAIVLPGVEIGDNCIIGAGSIVTKNVPPRSVCAGVPARVISDIDSWAEKVTNREGIVVPDQLSK